MLMAEMTFEEVKVHLNHNRQLIVPVGTCEQHGPHLPLNNDILCAEILANKLSEKTGALVAPTINYGVNLPCDKFLADTTTISEITLRETVLSITSWWREQGFSQFFLLTYHGDPFHIKALSYLCKDIRLLEPYEIEYADILEKQATIKHACEAETSLALFLYPEKVRRERITESDIPFAVFEDYLFHKKTIPPARYTGNLGFPSAATAEKGEIIFERMMEKLLHDVSIPFEQHNGCR
ncbi:MAG: creatininase family protein [Oscillospiraceae bacterium]|jgi:creatinine amidohydrolase|nr:creatininase family protein [Oscillospiraceae bacterium]